jgi:hypothetical protein
MVNCSFESCIDESIKLLQRVFHAVTSCCRCGDISTVIDYFLVFTHSAHKFVETGFDKLPTSGILRFFLGPHN